jgi:hypothetical protein
MTAKARTSNVDDPTVEEGLGPDARRAGSPADRHRDVGNTTGAGAASPRVAFVSI